MSVSMADQSKAMRLARELVQSFDTGDIQTLVFDHLDWKTEHEPLFTAVDPCYTVLRNEQRQLYQYLTRKLTSQEDREILERCSNVSIHLQAIVETAAFHLGFAAAVRFLGREADPNPGDATAK